jgi:hypothetical protein
MMLGLCDYIVGVYDDDDDDDKEIFTVKPGLNVSWFRAVAVIDRGHLTEVLLLLLIIVVIFIKRVR